MQSTVPDIAIVDIALRLLAAAALTGAIGLEREVRERAAGLRTHMLVGVGAALFTVVSAYAWSDFVFDRQGGMILDPTRVAAQIVTGIGFLGAGAIIRQGVSVRGLTTAAGLWVVAAIGMAAGAGFYSAAVIATSIVLIGLGPIRWVEGGRVARRLRTNERLLEVDLRPDRPVGPVLDGLERHRVRVTRVELADDEDLRQVRLEVELPRELQATALVETISGVADVTAVRWRL